MAWMLDEYSSIIGKSQFGVITGKPLSLGGSPGRSDATAKGGMYTLREAARKLGIDLSKVTMAIQGYGNAGSYAASLAESMFGCKIVAVSDSKGGAICEEGLCIPKIAQHKSDTLSVANCAGTSCIANEALLELDVDVLVLAAMEGMVTGEECRQGEGEDPGRACQRTDHSRCG